jgi:hypothetical protein
MCIPGFNADREKTLASITKAEIVDGLTRGLVFVQPARWAHQEKEWVDELIAEGKAYGFWEFHPEADAVRMVRRKNGNQSRPLTRRRDDRRWVGEHGGRWLRECSTKTFLFEVLNAAHKPRLALRAAILLRKMARERNMYPNPLTPAFLADLASYVSKRLRASKPFKPRVEAVFQNVIARYDANVQLPIEDSLESTLKKTGGKFWLHPLDAFLASHGLAPMAKIVIPPSEREREIERFWGTKSGELWREP